MEAIQPGLHYIEHLDSKVPHLWRTCLELRLSGGIVLMQLAEDPSYTSSAAGAFEGKQSGD